MQMKCFCGLSKRHIRKLISYLLPIPFQLCTSLETANKLAHATTTNARLLSEKVEELEKIVKRGDSAVAAARTAHATLNQKGLPSA